MPLSSLAVGVDVGVGVGVVEPEVEVEVESEVVEVGGASGVDDEGRSTVKSGCGDGVVPQGLSKLKAPQAYIVLVRFLGIPRQIEAHISCFRSFPSILHGSISYMTPKH